MVHFALSRAALVAASAGLIAIAAAPAAAAVASDPTTAEGEGKPEPAKPRAEAKRETIYCFDTEATGSHIVKRVCKTRDEWIKSDGIDPVRRMRQ